MRNKLKIFIILFIYPLFLQAKSITSEQADYVSICLEAAENPEIFSLFRTHPAIVGVIDTVNAELGMQYLTHIRIGSPEYLIKLPLLKNYDSIGTPYLHEYPQIGKMNPTTLRYLKIASDLRRFFGPLDGLRIVEIGGGYGGLAAIISMFEGCQSYCLIDLPEALKLASAFLNQLDIDKISYYSPSQLHILEDYDLLISNYAFSEIDRKEQLNYLNQLISKVPRGYMILNFSDSCMVRPLTLESVNKFLKSCGYSVTISPEIPQSHPKNVLLLWKST